MNGITISNVQVILLLMWAPLALYLKWLNTTYSREARKYGVKSWGLYWVTIDIKDPNCPDKLREKIKRCSRLFGISGLSIASLVLLIQIFSRKFS